MASSPDTRKASRHYLWALPLSHSRLPMSLRKQLMHNGCHPGFCGCHPEDISLDNLALVASGSCIHGFNGLVPNKETILNCLAPSGFDVPREQTEIHISQSAPEEGILPYLINFFLESDRT